MQIGDSFKVFKKEILDRAENSRTGQKISKSVIDAYDLSEQLRGIFICI
jgi:hypothetical protein